ncbi:MAG: hypothetical protein D9V47_03910 [Clostridia bacterium]|nr:MAG: hypothetical protein D9V47_03910 [Clostridia bacterium]
MSLVGLSSRSWQHSLELLAQGRYYVAAIATGFGTAGIAVNILGIYPMLRLPRAGNAPGAGAALTGRCFPVGDTILLVA